MARDRIEIGVDAVEPGAVALDPRLRPSDREYHRDEAGGGADSSRNDGRDPGWNDGGREQQYRSEDGPAIDQHQLPPAEPPERRIGGRIERPGDGAAHTGRLVPTRDYSPGRVRRCNQELSLSSSTASPLSASRVTVDGASPSEPRSVPDRDAAGSTGSSRLDG